MWPVWNSSCGLVCGTVRTHRPPGPGSSPKEQTFCSALTGRRQHRTTSEENRNCATVRSLCPQPHHFSGGSPGIQRCQSTVHWAPRGVAPKPTPQDLCFPFFPLQAGLGDVDGSASGSFKGSCIMSGYDQRDVLLYLMRCSIINT